MDDDEFEALGDGLVMFKPKVDEDGYVGRECPAQDCGKYFKIIPAEITDMVEVESSSTHCPYCGQRGTSTEFATQDQLDYAADKLGLRILDELLEPLRALQKKQRRTRQGDFQFTLGVEIEDTSSQISEYLERQDLETRIVCDECGGGSAIYGKYGYCPHCGAHNNLQVLEVNFDIASKLLSLSVEHAELAEKIVELALADCVAAFDGWGRATCRAHEQIALKPLPKKISFQNIDHAIKLVRDHFGIDLAADVDPAHLDEAKIAFQKRHLHIHSSGVIDEDYIERTGQSADLLGRQVKVTGDEVLVTITVLRAMAKTLVENLRRKSDR